MAGWLSKAGQVFGGGAKPVPQPFDIRCSCGGRVTGVRDDQAKQLPCPGCRQSILVLPATPYPIPKRAAPPPPRPAKPADDDAGSAPGQDAPAPTPDDRPLKKSLRKRGANRPIPEPSPTKPDLAATASPGTESPTKPPNPMTGEPPLSRRAARRAAMAATGEAISRWFRRVFTPVRMVALILVSLVVGTGFALRQRELSRQLEQTVSESGKLGELAVRERDWPAAADAYRQVAVALDRLGRTDPPARRLRQWDRELSALTRPLPRSLPDLVAEAAGESWMSNDLDWAELFRASYGDQWLVFEAWVDPGADGAPPHLSVPLIAGRYRATLTADLPTLSMIPAERLPVRVILAARLASIDQPTPVDDAPLSSDPAPPASVDMAEPPLLGPAGPPASNVPEPPLPVKSSRDDRDWVIRIDPDSVFLWARLETLAETGLLLSDDDRAAAQVLLTEQARWLGVEE